MESKDHIRNTNPEELLKTHDEQLLKDGDANDKELDFHIATDALSTKAMDSESAVDAAHLTDARELDGSLLAESGSADEIEKADWGNVDPQATPGGSRSGMDPSGPGSGI